MPNLAKALARAAFATSSATLYTVPTTGTTTVVTNIAIVNTTATAGTFDISLDGVKLFDAVAIGADTTVIIDLKQVLDANATPKTITGFASATSINYHISGMEIS
jgi:hypothetical protein